MERETGLEPATSSLGKRLSIDNKEHSVLVGLFLAIEFSQFHFEHRERVLMVFNRCSRIRTRNISPACAKSLRHAIRFRIFRRLILRRKGARPRPLGGTSP